MRLTAWPPLAVYAVVAAMALLENFLPPVPADAIIALAAFLSHRGDTSATAVYAVTWVSNVFGAGLVYLLARRWGRPFFASRLGRRLVTPEAVVAVERGYLRLGLVGLFLARLLPGFRSFTAAFAGIVRLGPVRAFLPIALASAVWYGGIIFFAARLGRDWNAVSRFITGLNRTFGGLAVALVLGGAAWWLIRRRRRSRIAYRDRITQELAVYPDVGERALRDPAAAALGARCPVAGDRPDRPGTAPGRPGRAGGPPPFPAPSRARRGEVVVNGS
ncbi:MAG: associated protein [Gemmatimonadetes bacterium]|nr:associated protein [Gemmatimonadota bacterium]